MNLYLLYPQFIFSSKLPLSTQWKENSPLHPEKFQGEPSMSTSPDSPASSAPASDSQESNTSVKKKTTLVNHVCASKASVSPSEKQEEWPEEPRSTFYQHLGRLGLGPNGSWVPIWYQQSMDGTKAWPFIQPCLENPSCLCFAVSSPWFLLDATIPGHQGAVLVCPCPG